MGSPSCGRESSRRLRFARRLPPGGVPPGRRGGPLPTFGAAFGMTGCVSRDDGGDRLEFMIDPEAPERGPVVERVLDRVAELRVRPLAVAEVGEQIVDRVLARHPK